MSEKFLPQFRQDLEELSNEWTFQRQAMAETYRDFVTHSILQKIEAHTQSHAMGDFGRLEYDLLHATNGPQWKFVLQIGCIWDKIYVPPQLIKEFGQQRELIAYFVTEEKDFAIVINQLFAHIKQKNYSLHNEGTTIYIPAQHNTTLPAPKHYRR